MIPQREFKDGVRVSAIGLGGYHLGLIGSEAEAMRIVHAALDAGLTFMDNAWEYNDGISEERMGRALRGRRDQAFVMTKLCSHGRDADVCMRQLEDSLRRLQTDHLDLWQIHEVVYDNDPERHYRGGAVDAIDRAKREGKVRFVGFTGHKDPDIHLEMLARGYAFDTVQMPLSVFDGSYARSFERAVLPEVRRRGMHAIGMKSMGGEGQAVKAGEISPQDLLRYAMSLPVLTTVSGIDSMEIFEQNLRVADGFTPLDPGEMEALCARHAEKAANGRFELYKTTAQFDALIGREQHGFLSPAVLPL